MATSPLAAQSPVDDAASLIEAHVTPPPYRVKPEPPPVAFSFRRVSEAETVLLGTFRVYQAGLSSQDMHTCNFTPSCSRFAVQAVRQAGLVQGSLLAADRLARCNGLPVKPGQYAFDAPTRTYLDPIEPYVETHDH